ncbi:methyltransferase domain-containing protein [Nordella sp. HKS 07]|uniref:methyltransferase domain-containing protein n=1 Tax=Nordella sp. HKS 07 TaxID=2712222 RepID=UPI0013E1FB5D|nr:methyltransferase domain-containing protein [Nordella sp. HKS 07]QIG49373.1 methyltransferase domain-containing protein [Nordella sp. HKS 07]
MPEPELFVEHWANVDAESMARYEIMFQWSAAADAFYAAADIRDGLIVADFGCGPGHTAIEFARRVGPGGHVHALDINADFLERTRQKAVSARFVDRITTHLIDSERLPLANAVLDRMTARNTIIYVRDPSATFAEFRRVLKPDGIVHVIEGDWALTAVEPLGEEWRTLVAAASWSWRTPDIGRRLHGIVRRAGFSRISLEILTKPDMEGRLLGMIRTVAGLARESGRLEPARINAALDSVDRSLVDGTFLAITPQFIVTARL